MKKLILILFTIALLLSLPACNAMQESKVSVSPIETGTEVQPENSIIRVSFSPDAFETTPPEDLPSGIYQTDNDFNGDGSVKIDIYVNDALMDVKVFEDYFSEQPGEGNLTSYVQAQPIFELLGIEYSISEPENRILLVSEKYGKKGFHYRNDVRIIGGEVYIRLRDLETYTGGWLQQAGFHLIYLYTGDKAASGDRLKFLPATLEECYTALDAALTPERIEFFKNARNGDIINEHFGLGLWIRNNWIYPEGSRLTDFFVENSVNSPDGMSGIVMEGYVKYLSGQPCSLEDLIG